MGIVESIIEVPTIQYIEKIIEVPSSEKVPEEAMYSLAQVQQFIQAATEAGANAMTAKYEEAMIEREQLLKELGCLKEQVADSERQAKAEQLQEEHDKARNEAQAYRMGDRVRILGSSSSELCRKGN